MKHRSLHAIISRLFNQYCCRAPCIESMRESLRARLSWKLPGVLGLRTLPLLRCVSLLVVLLT